MPTRQLDPHNLDPNEDWEGNNAAVTCPHCSKVYIVSAIVHRGERRCPSCRRSAARISAQGGRGTGGTASIQW